MQCSTKMKLRITAEVLAQMQMEMDVQNSKFSTGNGRCTIQPTNGQYLARTNPHIFLFNVLAGDPEACEALGLKKKTSIRS